MKSRVTLLGVLCALAGLALPLLLPTAHRAEAALRAAHNDTSTPFNLVSMPALIAHHYDGRALRTRVVARQPRYTRYAIRYRSGRLAISGVMNVPVGRGPFPVVVIAHGYRTPALYSANSGLVHEQAALATHGYVVLQPDYRNYGLSSHDTHRFVAHPLGYPEDLINAVRALHRAHLPFVARGPVGVLGRSMGGGVALQALAARPRMFDAAVLYSPLSTLAGQDYRRWVRGNQPLQMRVVEDYGRPASNAGFWRQASVRHYLGRITAPLQINHGKADPVCPVAWSEATTRALRQAGKQVRLFEYAGQPHRFHGAAWQLFMRRALRFYQHHL